MDTPTEHKLTKDDIRRAQMELAEGHAVIVHSFGAYRQLVEATDRRLERKFVGEGTMIAVREADE